MLNEIKEYLESLEERDIAYSEFDTRSYQGIRVFGSYGEEYFQFRIRVVGKNVKRALFEYKGNIYRYNSSKEVNERINKIITFNKEIATLDKDVFESYYLNKQVFTLLKLNEKEKFLSAYTEQNLRIDYNKLCSKYNESRAKIIELRKECSDERE